MGAVLGSGSALTKKGETKAFPESKGVDWPCSCSSAWLSQLDLRSPFLPYDAVPGGSAGNKRQPTVNRGSCRMSRSDCARGSKSLRSICTIGGGSTGRLSLSPAPHARAAMGCCRMCRWYRDPGDTRRCGGCVTGE